MNRFARIMKPARTVWMDFTEIISNFTKANDKTVKEQYERLCTIIDKIIESDTFSDYMHDSKLAEGISKIVAACNNKSEAYKIYSVGAIIKIKNAGNNLSWQDDVFIGSFLARELCNVQGTPLLLKLLELYETNSKIVHYYGWDSSAYISVCNAVLSNIPKCINDGRKELVLPLMKHVLSAAESVQTDVLLTTLELVRANFTETEVVSLALEALIANLKTRYNGTDCIDSSATFAKKLLPLLPEDKKDLVCQILKYDAPNSFYETVMEENLLPMCAKVLYSSPDPRFMQLFIRYAKDHGDEELEKYFKCAALAKLCFYRFAGNLYGSEVSFPAQNYFNHYIERYSIDTIYDEEMESHIYSMIDNHLVVLADAKHKLFDQLTHIMRIQVDKQVVKKDMTNMVLRLFRNIGMTIVSAMRAKINIDLPYTVIYSSMILLQSVTDKANAKDRKEMKAKLSVKNIVSVFHTISDLKRIDRALNQVLALMSSGFARDVCSKDFDIKLLKQIGNKFVDDDTIKNTVSRLINRVRCTVFEVNVEEYVDVTIVAVKSHIV